MCPRVVPDFVSFRQNALDNGWIAFGILTDPEKGRFDVSLLEDVQEPGSGLRARPVIESHGDVRAIDVDVEPGRRF